MPYRLAFLISLVVAAGVFAGPTDAQLDAALAAVKKEKKVKDATWNSRGFPSLIVGVWDDKTRRDGYAQYLCGVLKDHGVKGGKVRILDQAAALKDEWTELGTADCPN